MKTVSHIIHHMLFHFLSLWGYFNIFAKRKLDCCLYFINLLIWLKWLQANFKQAFPQGRDRRLWKERDKKEIIICVKRKGKWILISFLHIKFIPLYFSCWVFCCWSCLILDQTKVWKKKKILSLLHIIEDSWRSFFFFFGAIFHFIVN